VYWSSRTLQRVGGGRGEGRDLLRSTAPPPQLQTSRRGRGRERRRDSRALVHLADEGVDLVLAVTGITTLDEVAGLLVGPGTSGVGELEGPEEVVGLLEVLAAGGDLVDKILNADDVVLAEGGLDDAVVGEGDALGVDLAVSALVDELADGLEVGFTVGDVGLDELEHLLGGLGEADEDTVVELEETEELEDLAGLGGDLHDTLDADDKGNLGLGGNVEVAGGASLALKADLVTLDGAVLLDVLVGALEDDGALGLVLLEVSKGKGKGEGGRV
jgi:hypothetical protein